MYLYYRLGEVCSHVAALLFFIEIAIKEGLHSPSPTSLSCSWNHSSKRVNISLFIFQTLKLIMLYILQSSVTRTISVKCRYNTSC